MLGTRRHRLARAREAGRLRRMAHGRTRARRRRRPGRRPRLLGAAPRRPPRRRGRRRRARRRARQRGRGRDRACPSGAGAKIRRMSVSVSTHVLDTGSGAARRRRARRARPGARSRGFRGDRRRRPDRRARYRSRAGSLRARLLAALALLHARRARGRARGRPLPRPAPRLAVRVRELPRKLSVEELSELFEGRTRLVERLAEIERPARIAPTRSSSSLTEEEKVEALAAHPAIGQQTGLSARSAAEQGSDDDPCLLAELAALQQGVREEVRLPLRRLREPTPEGRDPRRAASSGSAERARTSSTPGAASSSRSRGIDGPVPEGRPRRPPADAPRGRRDRVDRRLLLLRPPRPWAPSPEAIRGCRGRRRGRVLGSTRRRALPLAEVPPRAGGDARAPPLVQVGGVHDVALGIRALRRPLLHGRGHPAGRPVRRRPVDRDSNRAERRRNRPRVDRLRRSLPHRRSAQPADARRRRDRPRRARGVGLGRALRGPCRVPRRSA